MNMLINHFIIASRAYSQHLLPCSCCHGGGRYTRRWFLLRSVGPGGGWGLFCDAASWSSSPAASCCLVDGAIQPSILQAKERPLPPSLLASESRHKDSFNLRLWRPYCYAMVGSRCDERSGHVPDVIVVGHGVV